MSIRAPGALCDVCRTQGPNGAIPVSRNWLACGRCRKCVEGDEREALLERVLLRRAAPNRFRIATPPKVREQARRLHKDFWTTRCRPARPA